MANVSKPSISSLKFWPKILPNLPMLLGIIEKNSNVSPPYCKIILLYNYLPEPWMVLYAR